MLGEASTGRGGLAVGRAGPDMILMDVRMRGAERPRGGAAHPGRARRRGPGADADDLRRRRIRLRRAAGRASGFLLKDAPLDDLVTAVRVVSAGNSLFAPSVRRRLIGEFAARGGTDVAGAKIDRLTDRETEVLGLVGRGLSNTEIAEALVITEQTTTKHRVGRIRELGSATGPRRSSPPTRPGSWCRASDTPVALHTQALWKQYRRTTTSRAVPAIVATMKIVLRPGTAVAVASVSLAAVAVLWWLLDRPLGIDSTVYRAAGFAVSHGEPLYAPLSDLPGWAPELPFTYPPFAALVFVPLVALPAQLCWGLVAVAAPFAVFLVLREFTDRWWLLLVAFGLHPVWQSIGLGQLNLVLMALVVVDVLRLRGSRYGGVLIGLAAAVKLVPLIFIGHLLLTGRRAMLRAAATFAAATTLGAVLLPATRCGTGRRRCTVDTSRR